MPITQRLYQQALLSAATGLGPGSGFNGGAEVQSTFQATIQGSGALSGTVNVEASNDNVNWVQIGQFLLAGTDSFTDGITTNAPWGFYRGNVTAISGTNAAITLIRGA